MARVYSGYIYTLLLFCCMLWVRDLVTVRSVILLYKFLLILLTLLLRRNLVLLAFLVRCLLILRRRIVWGGLFSDVRIILWCLLSRALCRRLLHRYRLTRVRWRVRYLLSASFRCLLARVVY